MNYKRQSSTTQKLLTAASLIGIGAMAPSTSAASQGLDLERYCDETFGNTAYAELTSYDAYGWRCIQYGNEYSMDLNAACGQQYADGVGAEYYDFSDPFSWFCRLETAYTSFAGDSYQAEVWSGDHVALLTTAPGDFETLSAIVDRLDAAYAFYHAATGREPLPAQTYADLSIIAALPPGLTTCGAGCGYLGATGIELAHDTYTLLYSQVHDLGLYDQVPFYELGRNFWFYGDALEYKEGSQPVTTGYAIAMRFLSMESSGVAGAPFGALPFSDFRDQIESMVDLYTADQALNWSNTLYTGTSMAWTPWGTTDLFASFVLRLERVHGESFIAQVWQQADGRPNAVTTQDAVDNFVIAASLAANANLHDLFANTWRWPLSNAAQVYLQANLGAPVDSTPYL